MRFWGGGAVCPPARPRCSIGPTHLVEWQHDEGAAAAGVHDHGDELGVDGAEVAVPGHLGDANVVVALVGLERLAEDVAELAGAHDAPGHGGLRGE